jgi:Na+-transporting methylmalonyl-CoA/oxaloacetate decarboxylase gamma subunit
MDTNIISLIDNNPRIILGVAVVILIIVLVLYFWPIGSFTSKKSKKDTDVDEKAVDQLIETIHRKQQVTV